jgi:DNA-directed RNA polymerase specialized sigma24 family protein
VVNLARNRRRRLMDRRPPRSLEPLLAVGFEPADERTTSGASTSIGREDGAALAQALLRLPNPMRAAVVLRHVDGLSVAEVAAALSRPENTIKSDVHRGLQRLRADLERSGTIDAAPRGVQPPRPRTERLNGQTLESLP